MTQQQDDKLEQKISEALALREKSKTEFLNELNELSIDYPKNSTILHLLANTQWELKQYHKATLTARKLLEINSRDESASLVLFHCLWAGGEWQNAVTEMERFQDISSSDDYDAFEKWIGEWSAKRAEHDFSALLKYGEKQKPKQLEKEEKKDEDEDRDDEEE